MDEEGPDSMGIYSARTRCSVQQRHGTALEFDWDTWCHPKHDTQTLPSSTWCLPHLGSRGSDPTNVERLDFCCSPLKHSPCIITTDTLCSPHHPARLRLHVHGRWSYTSSASVVSTVRWFHWFYPSAIRAFFVRHLARWASLAELPSL